MSAKNVNWMSFIDGSIVTYSVFGGVLGFLHLVSNLASRCPTTACLDGKHDRLPLSPSVSLCLESVLLRSRLMRLTLSGTDDAVKIIVCVSH